MQNDMRDRLVEIINKDNCPSPYMCDEKCKYSHLEHCIGDRLADHIIADGWIRPPCKVGQTVYTISINREIEEYVVSGICLYPNGWFVEFYYEDKPYSIHIDDVFLTKDQAEQKLKELSENGNL